MTKKSFLENFKKIYGSESENVNISKTTTPLVLLGEATADIDKRIIGTGITPDTIIGIMPQNDGSFQIRETDSIYMADFQADDEITNKDKKSIGEISDLVLRMVKGGELKGAKILFHSDCEKGGSSSRLAATAVGISSVIGRDFLPGDLLGVVMPNNTSYKDNSKLLLSMTARENTCAYIQSREPVYFPFFAREYEVVIITAGKKELKPIDFKSVVRTIRKTICRNTAGFYDIDEKEIGIMQATAEYNKALFALHEAKRVAAGADYLNAGNPDAFSRLVKESAREYLSLYSKSVFSELFELAEDISPICGVYENRGIFAFVQKKKVDGFISTLGKMFEKKTGILPEFYICSLSSAMRVKSSSRR